MITINYCITEDANQVTPHTIYQFLKHIDRVYLQLSPAHQSFTLMNTTTICEGAIIENTEKAGFQQVCHRYTVETDTPQHIVLVSPRSMVSIGGIMRMPVHVTVAFFIDNDATHVRLRCELTLSFYKKIHEVAARLIGTYRIWNAHVQEEMENGRRIFMTAA
jgi:hypothetical protein